MTSHFVAKVPCKQRSLIPFLEGRYYAKRTEGTLNKGQWYQWNAASGEVLLQPS